MNNCAFTIVAKNYIGLAQILGNSLKDHNENIDFHIFVADEFNDEVEIPTNVHVCKNLLGYSEEQWTNMTFKYDLTEFCTSIKPACFQYLFSKNYNNVIYFDPDIFIFSSIDEINEKLDDFDIALTPQIAGIHVNYNGEHPEWAMNVNGIFNLGFCGMKNSEITKQILSWWRKRLIDNCFVDRSVGNFTDQKWMDWLPGFLGNEHLYVFHDLGMNMAPWNFFERQLFIKDGKVMVKYRTNDNNYREDKLVFLHFAGYDYQKLKQGIVSRKRIENLKEYDDLHYATDIYRDAIVKNSELFDKYINQTYSYSHYNNGDTIQSFHRRLYHGETLKGNYVDKKSPFSTGKDSFYYKIKKKGMIIEQNLDKVNKNNLSGMNRKRQMIAILFRSLYKLMGYKRYVLFVKSLYNYCRPEWHTFLINKK